MFRRFVSLAIIAAAIWYGYQYYNTPPEPPPVIPTVPTPTPTPAPTLGEQRSALLGFSRTILGPLDATGVMPQSEALAKFEDLQSRVGKFAGDPDYPRSVQACGLIAQALQERGDFMARFDRDSKQEPSKMDPVKPKPKAGAVIPGAADPNAQVEKPRLSFFATAVLSQWNTRTAYYRPAIEQLLAPTGR